MTTFSQMVDLMIQETLRPELRLQIASYLNQTIRELHFDPRSGNAIAYRENFMEASITASVEYGATWDIPEIARFQHMQVVRFDSVWDQRDQVYPPEVVPSRALAGETRYYYRGGSRYVFAGYGGLNGIIKVGYYLYPRKCQYYVVADRPAQYDSDLGWTYGAGIVTDEQKLIAQEYVTNWLLMRWDSVIEEGLRAKIYKRLEQTERARTAYSLYTTLRQGLMTSESDASGQFQ